jgi:hypothetical protein
MRDYNDLAKAVRRRHIADTRRQKQVTEAPLPTPEEIEGLKRQQREHARQESTRAILDQPTEEPAKTVN